MTAKEIYLNLDEDYSEVLSRLVNDERITKYLKKFIVEDYTKKMKDALAVMDWSEAFCMAHSLKGMGMNMGMTKLYTGCDVLCEALRNGEPTKDISLMVEMVSDEYSKIVNLVNQLD